MPDTSGLESCGISVLLMWLVLGELVEEFLPDEFLATVVNVVC